jgi:hypothetical protein
LFPARNLGFAEQACLVRFKKERITNLTSQGENMKNLRKLGAAVFLTAVLVVPAFAGQTDTSPCTPPEPGQTSTPPCSAVPGDMETPTLTSTVPGDVSTPNDETLFTKIAGDVLLNLLPLF